MANPNPSPNMKTTSCKKGSRSHEFFLVNYVFCMGYLQTAMQYVSLDLHIYINMYIHLCVSRGIRDKLSNRHLCHEFFLS